MQTILSTAKERQREFFGGSSLSGSSFWTQASKCHRQGMTAGVIKSQVLASEAIASEVK